MNRSTSHARRLAPILQGEDPSHKVKGKIKREEEIKVVRPFVFTFVSPPTNNGSIIFHTASGVENESGPRLAFMHAWKKRTFPWIHQWVQIVRVCIDDEAFSSHTRHYLGRRNWNAKTALMHYKWPESSGTLESLSASYRGLGYMGTVLPPVHLLKEVMGICMNGGIWIREQKVRGNEFSDSPRRKPNQDTLVDPFDNHRPASSDVEESARAVIHVIMSRAGTGLWILQEEHYLLRRRYFGLCPHPFQV